MQAYLSKFLKGHKTLLLGLGREGLSTYRAIRREMPDHPVTIADKDPRVPERAGVDTRFSNAEFALGDHYLDAIREHTLIIKSPGISLKGKENMLEGKVVTSQTDIFLKLFASQIIGITGTKGKSTTSSLIRSILSSGGHDALLMGNIGVPPLDTMDRIGPATRIVFELSSHQLEYVNISPSVGVLLNIFQEHLDHYPTFESYKSAKFNIARFRKPGDLLVYDLDEPETAVLSDIFRDDRGLFPFSVKQEISHGIHASGGKVVCRLPGQEPVIFDFTKRTGLPGTHNLKNIMAATGVAIQKGIPEKIISEAIHSFRGLDHRLEHIGNFGGVDFYDDAIATVPEAVMAAVDTLKKVDVLILGGMDRGVDYSRLAAFLHRSGIRILVLSGSAGVRIRNELERIRDKQGGDLKWIFLDNFRDLEELLPRIVTTGDTCLLSPAAPSYDSFSSFRDKGNNFKKWASGINRQ